MAVYLRVEGMNLGNFVFDTADLSTIRGGGLILLHSIEQLREHLQNNCRLQLTTILQGASTGLFQIEGNSDVTVVRRQADEWLRDKYPHATFAVDTASGGEFERVVSQLTTANRIRQMKSPSLIYPKVADVTQSTSVCKLDLVRPGAPQNSESSESRRDYGRKQKQKLYFNILKQDGGFAEAEIPKLQYVNELGDLAGNSGSWGNLGDKMAVIAVDGNNIGKKCKGLGVDDLGNFSRDLRKYQAQFLMEALRKFGGEIAWKNGDEMRIETLLWGGDEVIWVVPAWTGLAFLQEFFAHVVSWPKLGGAKLTFSAGVVFCNHKSPIHAVRDLADDLCKKVKDWRKELPEDNMFGYQVLESFDRVADVQIENSSLTCEELTVLTAEMPQIRTYVPRRKLHELIQAIYRGDVEAANRAEKGALRYLDPVHPVIANSLRGNTRRWRIVCDLWDYLAPEEGGR
jgi:hypothetical protein